MSELTLVIGNKNFSSWSMRAWLALEQTGAPFREEQIWIDEDRDRSERRRYSPTGRVPVLKDGDFAIWDTLAICEYLAERFPEAGLWPSDPRARARARSICAEMHAGFHALRANLPMNTSASKVWRDRGPEVEAEVARIVSMWNDARREFGAGGDFLFGGRTIADAFYAPVASRFRTYSIPLEGAAAAYAESVLALPAVRRWMEAAEDEEHSIPEYASMP